MNITVFLSGGTLTSFLLLILIAGVVFGFPLFVVGVTLFDGAVDKRRRSKNRKEKVDEEKENEIASSQPISVLAEF